MQEIKDIFNAIDQMIAACEIDFNELKNKEINDSLFSNYSDQRIINSFLFNFLKIQDKIGAKLFRKILFELKEIDDYSIPMIDVLNMLEKMNIIENSEDWERLREIRNALAHEYPLDIQERIENIKLSLNGYSIVKNIYYRLREYCINRKIL